MTNEVPHDDSSFYVRNIFGKDSIIDNFKLARMIKHANVISTTLIATPSTGREFLHPLLVSEISEEVYKVLLKNRRQINNIAFIYLLLLPTLLACLRMPVASAIFAASLICIILAGRYELKNVYSSQTMLERKVKFYSDALHGQGRGGFINIMVPLAALIIQLLLVWHFGDIDTGLERFGLVYARAFSGEYYRFFTAPFFHSGVWHGFGNLIMFIWFAQLCQKISGYWTVAAAIGIAVIGNIIFAAAMTIIAHSDDGVIGLSGGVAGLAGMICGASLKGMPELPKAIHISLAPVILISFFAFAILSNASVLLHFIGFTLGVIVGIAVAVYRKRGIPSVSNAMDGEH